MRRVLRLLTPARALALIIAASAVCSLVVSLATPAWEANDEPDHVRNIETLASGRWYRIEPDAGYQPQQAPLYYLSLAALQKIVGMGAELPKPQQGDGDVANGLYAHGSPQESHDHRRLLLFRLPSVILGALTLWLTSRVAAAMGADPWIAVAATATVAAIPRFVFSSAFVNNDVLATALGAAVTLGTVLVWRDRGAPRQRLAALVGLGCGLLVVTKLTTLPMVGVVGLAVLWRCRRSWKALAAFVSPAVVVAAPLLIANQIRYGDPLVAQASVDYFRTWIPALLAVNRSFHWFGVTVLSGAATSFWYTSGWNQFRWKASSYIVLWALAAAGLAGHVVARLRTRVPGRVLGRVLGRGVGRDVAESVESVPAVPANAAATAAGTGVLTALALAAASSIWVIAWSATQWQGRIAFPGLAAFGTLVAMGWRRWGLPIWVAFVLPAVAFAGTLYAIKTDVLGRY